MNNLSKPIMLNNFKRTFDISTDKYAINEEVSLNQSHALIAKYGLSLRDQIHVFHWQTTVGDMHQALGEFYESFLDQMDNLMEVIMGKYGRISVKGAGPLAPLVDLSDVNVEEFVNGYATLFENARDSLYKNDPEIINIIDEIIASIHKLKYLLTMS